MWRWRRPRAGAQIPDPTTVRWDCTGSTTCTPLGSTTIVTTDSSPTLGFTNTGSAETGEAFLVVLVPSNESAGLHFNVQVGGGPAIAVAPEAGTFNSGNLYGFLGVGKGGSGDLLGFNRVLQNR